MSRALIRANDELEPIPDDDAVLAALAKLQDDPRYALRLGILASMIAAQLGVTPARRLGRGTVAGSWSGYMAPALRLSPRLLSLQRRGLVCSTYGDRSVRLYLLTAAGRARIES